MLLCLVTVVIVELTTPDRLFVFHYVRGDCYGRSEYLYQAIYRDSSYSELAFFGSSKTINGVNDSLLTALSGKRYLNLGFFRFGRNLDAYLAGEYLAAHHPKAIVVEVREEEQSVPHPETPFLLPTKETWREITFLKKQAPEHLYNQWLCHLKYVRYRLLDPKSAPYIGSQGRYGFFELSQNVSVADLNKRRAADSVQFVRPAKETIDRSSKYYLDHIEKLAKQNGCRLYFLYLPSYGNLYKKPVSEKDYLKRGVLLIPPDSILCEAKNYGNSSHLNKRGAGSLALWLAKALKN